MNEQSNNYVICWTASAGPKWEVVSGYDAMDIRVSEIVDSGVESDDIVVGSVLFEDDTN